MPALYIANKNYSSWSLRPWVMMMELGIPFEERLVPFGGSAEPHKFRAFSPNGKVPCLVDGTTVVWDSLAIIEYLAEQDPSVWPRDAATRAWARCVAAEMHSGFTTLRNACTMNCGVRIRIDPLPSELLADWERVAELWSEGLSRFGGPFLAGDRFTAVDAFFAPVAFRAQTYSPPLPDECQRYVQRLLELPSMQKWYGQAVDETWREEHHEAEARAAGAWLSDLRRSD
ncbi:MAG: glutathione S-transferase family protein [Lysobacter sp.]